MSRRDAQHWAAVAGIVAAVIAVLAFGRDLVDVTVSGGGGAPSATSPATAASTQDPPPTTSASPSTTRPSAPSTTLSTARPTSTPSEVAASSQAPAPAVGYIEAGVAGGVAYIREQPDLLSPVVGTVPDGTFVLIVCTARGDSVVSAGGDSTSDLWDYISPSGSVLVGGYVADTWVFTGTNEPLRPPCSSG